jgi:HD-like signal output (HDOD) protein
MTNVTELHSSLKTIVAQHPLPIIRQTAAQVISLLSDPFSNITTIANSILQDQAFTARVLKIANSAYYRRHGEKITTVTQALLRMGFTTLRDIAIAAEFTELVQKRLPPGVNLRRLLAKAVVAAHQASTVGQAAHLPQAEALFTSALLESLGELTLAAYLPNVVLKITETMTLRSLTYDAAHLYVTGMTTHEVTELVVETIELPQGIILPPPTWDTSFPGNSEQRRLAIVHLTNLCATNIFGPESPQVVSQLTALMPQIAGATELSLESVHRLLAEGFLKAMEFACHVDLDRQYFSLDGTTSPLSMRHAFIGSCLGLAEGHYGVGTAFA